ncbi:MAG: DUF2285 domain-containing protein [Novosphingobium sp.]
MSKLTFADEPPQTERVNSYDERHLVTYIRLLDAETEGACWQEVVHIIFGIDPEADPERARYVHETHLARAHWMTEAGYRHLLEPRLQ